MIRQFELVEKVKSYDAGADEELLNRAYVFSMKAHGSQKRASGDPYFLHPLEVAAILTDLKLDTATIVTALLHDTVEDTLTSLEEIESTFGKEIAFLVDGVTKLSKIGIQSDHIKQAENFRKLVLAMSADIRVLLVKLADRLHNMRTLSFISSVDKRHRIARETLDIYAPLAERIGMHAMKDELEDLAFAELNADARNSILARLQFLREDGGKTVDVIIKELQDVFENDGLSAIISGREKTAYSIWRKMRIKNISFEQLSDIIAFRVVVADIAQCYQALGILHSRFLVVPGRFKDYISTPKPNNYRSLHTGVIGPTKQRIEIQIRTQNMHDVAELGVAAHWQYKADESKGTQGPEYRWLRGLLEILENATNPEEFLEHTKLEMFQDQVFCFTPKGDLIALPKGATPIDFAYELHTHIGDHCVGVKINGKMMPLKTILENGDQVELYTSKSQTPSLTWERFVVTGKAKARIRKFFRVQQRDEHKELGQSILQKMFRQENHELEEDKLIQRLPLFSYKTIDDLYAGVGQGLVSALEIVHEVFPPAQVLSQGQDHLEYALELATKKIDKIKFKTTKTLKKNTIPIKGLIPGMAYHYAGCCHPLPGDPIAGVVSTGKGVTIHVKDCENLEAFSKDRILDVSWETSLDPAEHHIGRLTLVVSNTVGSLADVTAIILKAGGHVVNLKMLHRTFDFFDLIVDINVKDANHLNTVAANLRNSSYVNQVERVKY